MHCNQLILKVPVNNEKLQELLFVFKALQQAHRELCHCCGNIEDGQQDKLVEGIACTYLRQRAINNPPVLLVLLPVFCVATSVT